VTCAPPGWPSGLQPVPGEPVGNGVVDGLGCFDIGITSGFVACPSPCDAAAEERPGKLRVDPWRRIVVRDRCGELRLLQVREAAVLERAREVRIKANGPVEVLTSEERPRL